jgi:hypothetical protein
MLQGSQPENCSGWTTYGIFIRYSSLAPANMTRMDVKRNMRFCVTGLLLRRESQSIKEQRQSTIHLQIRAPIN